MSDVSIPNLMFPMIEFGKLETPWDLYPLLFRGGAGSNAKLVAERITQGIYGAPIPGRFLLVEKIHEHIEGKLIGGGRHGSTKTSIRRLREFFSWADSAGKSLTLEWVDQIFIDWTDYLLHRQRIVGDISEIHAYQCAVAVAKILDDVLDLKIGLLKKIRIRRRSNLKKIIGTKEDKQNLEQTFEFGHSLMDITDSLSIEAIQGSMPVSIRFRTGKIVDEWLRLKPPELMRTLKNEMKPSVRKKAFETHTAWNADISIRTRYPLVNLRIESEMLIFIAQTGMNLEQVHTLKMSKFRYQSHLDGYQVYRVYKGRRHGEVEFDIFSQYKKIFERYLVWRSAIFSEDDDALLFPLLRSGRLNSPPGFSMVLKYCKKLSIRIIRPRELRKTRVNWMLRRSQDPNMVAEMHAHTQETLIRKYEQPSLQVAMVEISRFHSRTDPAIASPGPGICISTSPQAILGIPPEATTPDCISPAGCIFCVHQRDIDSMDHIWSLLSYRHLKSLELSGYHPAVTNTITHPSATVIMRITAKLKQIEKSNKIRESWNCEALARIEEENYHPRWDGLIQLMEARI